MADHGKTTIRRCNCTSAYQDARYGVNERVHNLGAIKSGSRKVRCTVCGYAFEESARS